MLSWHHRRISSPESGKERNLLLLRAESSAFVIRLSCGHEVAAVRRAVAMSSSCSNSRRIVLDVIGLDMGARLCRCMHENDY